MLSSLQDSGIVRLEDFGSLENGRLYLRMEYLEGETLDHRLSRLGRLPGRQALELARQMATTCRASTLSTSCIVTSSRRTS